MTIKAMPWKSLLFCAGTAMLVGVMVTSSVMSAATATSESYPATPSWWTGSNPSLKYYSRVPGYPAYDAHPRYLGELRGTWGEIGEQYGARAGDLIRLVFEGWFNEVVHIQGSTAAVRDYVHQEEKYYEALAPEALELMQGVARGARVELAKSPYASVLTDY
jgi:hypothetical protein